MRLDPSVLPGRAAALVPALLAAALWLPAGCAPPPPPAHDGPIVLVTLDSLRADVLGGLGGDPALAPRLSALLAEADWGGRGIAPSSWGVPAMASLATGLRPWQHQAVIAAEPALAPELSTLAEALQGLGYETAGFLGGPWYRAEHGYDQGFGLFGEYGRGRPVLRRLAGLTGGRQFFWIHIPEPQAPYIRRDWLLPRLGDDLPDLPARVDERQLEPYFDPAVPLPAGHRRRFWALYRLNVAWADEKLGQVLDALEESGQWDRTLLVVTSNHGEEFGERGQILHGGNLGRQLLEVPLAIKLPAGFRRRVVPPEDARVATARIWATLVDAAGGAVPPAVAPSLLRPAPEAVLSELYLTNGTNRFSLVEGNRQLLWDSRFAAADPEYYRARLSLVRKNPGPLLGEPAEAIFRRLARAFEATPPLTGDGRPEISLERWEGTGSRKIDDPVEQRRMAERLARIWRGFSPGERPPAGEERAADGL
jgi:hypothetical protein